MAGSVAPWLPPGQPLELGRRGRTFVRQLPPPHPDAPTVVLLHGWMATADLNWFTAYRALAEHVGVVSFDQRGHGRGVRSMRPFRLEDCADDVAAVADALGLATFIPVGYSMGGAVTQLTWRRHPERVTGMVLCATAGSFGGRSVAGQAVFASMLPASAVVRMTPRVVRAQVFDRATALRATRIPMSDWAMSEVRRNDVAAVLQAGYAIGRFSSARWLGDVEVPAAVVMTTKDTLVAPERQRRMADRLRTAEVFPIPADHGACVTDAGRFVPALVSAVRSVGARSSAAPARAGR